MISPTVMLLGVGLAAGILLAVAALRPPAPDLSVILPGAPRPATGSAGAGWEERVGGWLAPRVLHPGSRFLRPPTDDLRVLGRSVEIWLGQKVGLALLGLAAPTLLAAAATLLGTGLPVVVPALAAIVLAVVLFLLPDWVVREAATAARAEFRHAVAIYIGWVAMARSSAGGPAESMERAARVGRGWALRILDATLTRARYSTQTPWQALETLGAEYGITQLDDLAAIMATAGAGASVYPTLVAKQAALLQAELAAEKAHANEQSERMVFPVVLLLIGFVVLLGYPMLTAVQ